MSVNVDHTTPTYCLITDAMSISLHDADTSLGHDETPQGEEILIFKFYSEARKRGVLISEKSNTFEKIIRPQHRSPRNRITEITTFSNCTDNRPHHKATLHTFKLTLTRA